MKTQFTLLLTLIVLSFSFISSETAPEYREVCQKVRDLSTKSLTDGDIVEAKTVKYFSRCYTGFAAHYDEKENTYPIYDGEINYSHGCQPEKVCLFRLNYKTDELLVKSIPEDKYVSLAKWIKKAQKEKNKSTSL
jgi:hypothetical protein